MATINNYNSSILIVIVRFLFYAKSFYHLAFSYIVGFVNKIIICFESYNPFAKKKEKKKTKD